MVYVPDRLLTQNPYSLLDALGRFKEVLPSQRDYNITLRDGTTVACDYSDIVSALATKSNSDVTLIDTFQLIDWKDSTPPDHRYPKFKLFLENFKNGHQVTLPAIIYQETQEPVPADDNTYGTQTGDQRLQQAMSSSELTELDTLLQKIMDPDTQSELLEKLKLLTTAKRQKNKRKSTQSKPLIKPSYNPPVAERSSIEDDKDPVANNEPTPKRRRRSVNTNPRSRYISPTSAPKHIKESNSNQEISTEYRRSSRVPRVTAKYLESIKAELRNSDEDE